MRIEYHRTLLADRVRNDAFERALKSLIRPGQTVVADIGAGTGFLGLLASRLGAREVFLYESAAIAQVTEQMLKKNRARNCHLMPFSSREMDDPPKVDVIVTETLGNYPLEEDIIATANDALRRHLRPGGTIIPSRIVQFVAPVVDDRFEDELLVWRRVSDLDCSPAEMMSRNNVYVRPIEAKALLPGSMSTVVWDRIDLTRQNKPTRKGVARWKLDSDVTVYGFATWWEVELAPGIVLSTAPGAARTHWEQLYFPVAQPLDAGAGEAVQISIRSHSSPETGTHLAWTATIEDKAGRTRTRHAHDLDKGYLP